MIDETLPASEATHDTTALSILRTETALSRFPIHTLTKGEARIELKNQAGAAYWSVDYGKRTGQAGHLAYKLDTLVVNRRIDEMHRPIGRVLKLGSLREICRALGINEGQGTLQVRQALLQNAATFITAKISFRTVERGERYLEASFNRYSVVFAGEQLPDGRKAESVYLLLNDIYAEILNSALTRPLDYDYMKTLAPMAQRFYEIVSYQVYAALRHRNQRARLRYSEYCLLSTATRYPDFDRVKKQMYKIHKPHLTSGYLARVEYEATTDEAGQLDWWMCYTPGPHADREFREFQGGSALTRRRRKREASALDAVEIEQAPLLRDEPSPSEAANETPPDPDLVGALTAQGVSRAEAERLAAERPDECRRQLDFLPFANVKSTSGAYLTTAIQNGFGPPRGYLQAQTEAQRTLKRRNELQTKQVREATQEAQRAAEDALVDESLIRLENESPEAFAAFLLFVESQRAAATAPYERLTPAIRRRLTAAFDTPQKRRELFVQWREGGARISREE